MNWWQGAVLGVVQGLTEFLPISSSGHLVVAQAAVGLSIPGVLVEVTLHVATLLAVLIVYWTRLGELVAGAIRGDRTAWGYVGLLVLGTIPAGAIGLLFADWFERAFDSLLMVGVSFLVTAGILWSTRRIQIVMVKQTPSWTGAFSIGLAQALAVMPGISRSGSTIAAGLWLGLDPVRAAEYSFLLAVPDIKNGKSDVPAQEVEDRLRRRGPVFSVPGHLLSGGVRTTRICSTCRSTLDGCSSTTACGRKTKADTPSQREEKRV